MMSIPEGNKKEKKEKRDTCSIRLGFRIRVYF